MAPLKIAVASAVLMSAMFAKEARAEKPAAVQICFNGLEGETALFSNHGGSSYHQLSGETFIMDMDLTFNGNVKPEKITRSGPSCLRAWLKAQPVTSISVDFSKTDLNLQAQTRQVNLKLKEDKWSEGGSFDISRGSYSAVSTQLPGTLDVLKQDPARSEERPIEDHAKLPAGKYLLRYEAPKGACAFSLSYEAGGTVRDDNRPDKVAQIVEYYRKEIAPSALKAQHVSCTPDEVAELHVRIWDGVIFKPLEPELRKVPKQVPGKYLVRMNGTVHSFTPGQPLEVGYGQNIVLEAAPVATASISINAP